MIPTLIASESAGVTDFLARFAAAAGPADPPGLQVLLPDIADLSADALRTAVRQYHPDLSNANVELAAASALPPDAAGVSPDGPPPAVVGLIEWADHAVKLIAFDAPMPPEPVAVCLRPALLPPEMKADARNHRGHILLYYAGRSADPFEQRVALAAMAGSIGLVGGFVTLNEEARAAVPNFALLPEADGEDMLAAIRAFPLPYLFAGFGRFELTDQPGVWMRTFAAHRLGLPELAYKAADHAQGEQVFQLLTGVLGYLRETGLSFEAGERIRVGEATEMTVREPTAAEWWLDTPGKMWVLEG